MRRSFFLTCWLAAPVVAALPLSNDEAARRDALTKYGLGLIRDRNELPAQAVKHFQHAADADPKAAAPLRELARLYAELGREPAAIRAARKAVALNPDDFETARILGRILTDAKQYPDATTALRLAADSKTLTDPVIKLAVLKELMKSADAARNAKAGEEARRVALKLITTSKAKLLQPGLFTSTELDRERAKLYEGLGTVLVARKEFSAASASFQTARDLYSDPKAANDQAGVARLHWHLSESLLAQGDATTARKELEQYLMFRPAAFEPYERLVEIYRRLGQADELPGVLAKLAAENRNNTAPQWLAASVSFAADPDAADAVFRKLIGKLKSPDEARLLVTAYREAGRPKELLDLLDKTFKAARPEGYDDDKPKSEREKPADPPPVDAVERSRLLSAAVKQIPPKHGFTKAVLKRLTDEHGGVDRHTDTLDLMSGLAFRDGQVGTIATVLHDTAKRRKGDYRLKWLTVRALEQLRRWDDLVTIADELSRSDKGIWYPGIAASGAIAYAEIGMRDAALKKMDSLGITPYLQVQRVRVLNILGEHSQALKLCEEELKNDRLSPSEARQVRLVQADSLNLLKKQVESETVLRQLLDDDPDDVLVLNNLGYNLADQGRKLDEAESFIRRAIELDKYERVKRGDPESSSGGYADSLGWVLFRQGKLTEARACLEESVTSLESAPDAIVWDHLGDVAFRQGDKKRASAAWKRAIELYAENHLGKQNGRLSEAEHKLKLAE